MSFIDILFVYILKYANETKKYIQETQHNRQTAARTAQNQDIEKNHECKSQKQEKNVYERWEYCLGLVSDKCHWGFNPVYTME